MIFDRRVVFVFLALALVVVGVLFAFRTNDPTTNDGKTGQISEKAAASEAAPVDRAAPRFDKKSAEPKRTVAETPERWQIIAKGTSLPLVTPGSLALGQGVIELLELNPTEVKGLNEDLGELVERVRTAEKKSAYVRVGGDGSEEIVVPPFDRGPLIRKFRDKVEKDLGKNVATFCAEQMLYDSSLALGNAEVRLYIEPKSETNGRDMLVISRGVHRRNPTGNPKWEGEAAPPLMTKTIAGKDFGLRYRHLFYMANKGLLPRKQEGAK